MKRIISLIMVLFLCLPEVAAQRLTATGAFVSAPVSILPLLDRNTRLDMVDYFRSDSSTPSNNQLSGKSRIIKISDDDVIVEMTEASTYQFALLPIGSDTIIALIKTLKTPIADSHIDFYTIDWEKIDKKMFSAPEIDDWLTKSGKKNRKTVEADLPFVLAEYKYDANSRKLVLANNMADFYQKEEYDKIAPYLKPTLIYRWTGRKMKLEK